jgi:hypothetical protein
MKTLNNIIQYNTIENYIKPLYKGDLTMESNRFELNERDLNISRFGEEDKFIEKVNEFIRGYFAVLNDSGNTFYYSIENIYPLLETNCLWGEGLHLFIDELETNHKSAFVGKVLKDIYLTNLHYEDDESIYPKDKGLKILEGMSLKGQDYLAYKLLQLGQGKVVYNTMGKFMLAYEQWVKSREEVHYLNEENYNDIDEDLYYWLDIADGEATSDIPPSERRLTLWDSMYEEMQPLYKKENTVISILTKFINLVLEAETISLKNKMALTELYTCTIQQYSLNGNLVYGQLRLILDQIKYGLSSKSIPLNYLEETVNDFYKSSELETYEICRLDFSRNKENCYVIFANFEKGFYKSIFLKRMDNKNEFLLSMENEQFSSECIQSFIDTLLKDVISKYSISELKQDTKELNSEADTKKMVQKNGKDEHDFIISNKQPIDIDEDDLPW